MNKLQIAIAISAIVIGLVCLFKQSLVLGLLGLVIAAIFLT